MERLTLVSVIRDRAMYGRCIVCNPYLSHAEKAAIDNLGENLPIPVRYNAFLDADMSKCDTWIMFCHEDFEVREDLASLLCTLDKNAIYGPVGSRRFGAFGLGFQQVLGGLEECSRDGRGASWINGKRVRTGVVVETVDCCCLIVHSSLIRRHRLRFDESLAFDLYAEDFCAMAKIKHGIRTRIVDIRACHHSGSRATDRLFRHLGYLEKKYPKDCFSGTCVYFGTKPPLMRLENWLLGRKAP